MIPTINGNPSSLVACHADRPAFVDLVIALDHLVPGLRDIGRKSEEKILRDALLDGNASGGALIVPPHERIGCRLEMPASFCTLLLTWLAACEAIIESVLWLTAFASCVVLPCAMRLMMSAVASRDTKVLCEARRVFSVLTAKRRRRHGV